MPSQPKGTRAYQDAASYNQHLAQHQAYTAQAQAASQAANNVFRNPYMSGQQAGGQQQAQGQQQQQQQPSAGTTYPAADGAPSSYQTQPGPPPPPQPAQHAYASQSSGQMAMGASSYPAGTQSLAVGLLNANPPTGTSGFYNTHAHHRLRANTINHDAIPPALARLQQMNQDVIAGRNALTPVLNRDDAMREWERRQAGKATAAQPYPQLEYLQQQAELAAAGGLTWSSASGGTVAASGSGPSAGATGTGRYQAPPSKLSHSYQPTIIVDDESRREAVMSNVRSAARGDAGPSTGYNPSAMVTSPAQTYATGLGGSGGTVSGATGASAGTGAVVGSGPTGGATSATRYPASYAAQQPNAAFEAIGQRTDIGSLYAPLQPDQFASYGPGAGPSVRQVPAQGQGPSFYAGQRNPFAGEQGQQAKDTRRMSGMDIWSR